jgi:hypothetical protein
MKLTEILAIWFIVAVVASPFVGSLLHKRRVKREFEERLARERELRKKRLTSNLELADAVLNSDTAWQQRARKAEGLGFIDENDYPRAS